MCVRLGEVKRERLTRRSSPTAGWRECKKINEINGYLRLCPNSCPDARRDRLGSRRPIKTGMAGRGFEARPNGQKQPLGALGSRRAARHQQGAEGAGARRNGALANGGPVSCSPALAARCTAF